MAFFSDSLLAIVEGNLGIVHQGSSGTCGTKNTAPQDASLQRLLVVSG
jgi:hypothetical protein